MYRSKIELHNVDCLPFMNQCEDNCFDLAIVDPPYGIDFAGDLRSGSSLNGGNGWEKTEKKDWDKNIPQQEYFDQLFRVSKNQIIWGGNYMTEYLPPSSCWLIWDKMQEFKGAVFEMAWTSFKSPAKAFRMSRVEAYANKNKIHPTQKPERLYEWILDRYANEGDLILDTHLGSGSIAVACDKMGYDLVGLEIDKEYFDKANKRLKPYRNQKALF